MDHYLCDFSVFQSALDHWAIGQSFPIMPLQRLNEAPRRLAVLVDLTCDSDGKIRRYVSAGRSRTSLEVQPMREGEPYHFGFFLMGAYQDIMVDAHNLFGRVAEVHIYADSEEPDGYYVDKHIPGMSVEEMLGHVQYFPRDLERRMNELLRAKTESGAIRGKDAVRLLEEYLAAFHEPTYLRGAQDEAKARGGSS